MNKLKTFLAITIITFFTISCVPQTTEPIAEPNSIETEPQTAETKKTYEGYGFTFSYPGNLIVEDGKFWTEEGYERHINPPEDCDLCHVPYFIVEAEAANKNLDQYIIDYFVLTGTGETLAEMSKNTGIPYETITIGNNEFIKITVSDMLDSTGYFTQNNNTIVSFEINFLDHDNEELREIIETLKFK